MGVSVAPFDDMKVCKHFCHRVGFYETSENMYCNASSFIPLRGVSSFAILLESSSNHFWVVYLNIRYRCFPADRLLEIEAVSATLYVVGPGTLGRRAPKILICLISTSPTSILCQLVENQIFISQKTYQEIHELFSRRLNHGSCLQAAAEEERMRCTLRPNQEQRYAKARSPGRAAEERRNSLIRKTWF